MQFGKGDASTGDAALPDDDPRTTAVLAAAPPGPLFAHAGCPTWANKQWRGSIYPADADDLLVAYGRAFNGLELNVTYYRVPDDATVTRWRDAVPDDFRFVAKVPKTASHEGDLRVASWFGAVMRGLGPKLGALFLQLPPGFAPTRVDDLRQLIAAFPADLPLAVELRHRSWFRGGALTPLAFDILAARPATAVITDAPGRRDVLHASLPLPMAVVRFLASEDDAVDGRRLDRWAERIARWRDAGLRELYFWLHAPDDIGAPGLVAAFRERFERVVGQTIRTAVPPPGQMPLL